MSDAWIIVLIYGALMLVAIIGGVVLAWKRRQEPDRMIFRSPFDEPSTHGR
jgi:uncharacterized iron-regulated membrane protein